MILVLFLLRSQNKKGKEINNLKLANSKLNAFWKFCSHIPSNPTSTRCHRTKQLEPFWLKNHFNYQSYHTMTEIVNKILTKNRLNNRRQLKNQSRCWKCPNIRHIKISNQLSFWLSLLKRSKHLLWSNTKANYSLLQLQCPLIDARQHQQFFKCIHFEARTKWIKDNNYSWNLFILKLHLTLNS